MSTRSLIVNKDSPFETLDDLIEFARENPQVVTVGGSGTYSANHLEMLRLEQAADIDLTYNFVDPRVYYPRHSESLRRDYANPAEKVLMHISNIGSSGTCLRSCCW